MTDGGGNTLHTIHDDLVLLLKIQDKDVRIRMLRTDLEQKPQEIAALKAQLVLKRKRLDGVREVLKKMNSERSSMEVDLESRIQHIHKYEAQSSQVKTNEEYKALLKEIEELKKGNAPLEDKILEVMENLEENKKNILQEEQLLKEEEKKVAGEEQEIQEAMAGMRTHLAEVEKEKEDLVRGVNAGLLERYQYIFANKDDYAIVSIEHGACGGCHMAITPQIANEVKRAQDVVLCENCARILFLQP